MEINKKARKKLASIEKQMLDKTKAEWHLTYGGVTPGKGEFGRTVIIPSLFVPLERWEEQIDEVTGNPYLVQYCGYRQKFTSGRHIIFQGKSDGKIPDGFRLAFVGMAFLHHGRKPPLKSFDFIIGDTQYPKLYSNLKSGAAIIFTQGYIVKENTRFIVYGDFVAKRKRYLRAVPLGWIFYKSYLT